MQNWRTEFPLDYEVFVKLDEKKYPKTVIDSKGCLVTLVYRQVHNYILKLQVGTHVL